MSRFIDADKIDFQYLPLAVLPDRFVTELQISKIPTADVEPVRHGHWIDKTIQIGIPKYHYIYCSECENGYNIVYVHLLIGDGKLFDCCPNCGAKMDGKDNDE